MNLNKIAGESFHGLQVGDIANLGSVSAFGQRLCEPFNAVTSDASRRAMKTQAHRDGLTMTSSFAAGFSI